MSEPCADRVDIHTGAQEMRRGGVADRYGGEPLISSADATTALLLDIRKKTAHNVCG